MLRASDIGLDVGCSPCHHTNPLVGLAGLSMGPFYPTLVLLGCHASVLQELQQYPGAIFTA